MAVFTDGGITPAPAFNADAALDNAAKGGGASPTQAGVPLIPVKYPGHKYNAAGAGSVNALEHGMADPAGRTALMDPDTASNAIYGWSQADVKAFARRAWYLGGLASPDDISGAYDLWDVAVKRAARFSAAGNPMDPQDVLDLMLTGDPSAQKAREAHKHAGQTITTQKKNPLNLSDPNEVRVFLDEAFRTKMGRGPTDAEVRTLTNALHSAERANPGTSSVTTIYDANGNVKSQTPGKATGGVNPNIFLSDQVANDPEAAEYQAAGPVFGAIMGALGPGAGMLKPGG